MFFLFLVSVVLFPKRNMCVFFSCHRIISHDRIYVEQNESMCVCVCFLPIHSGHQVRWTYQPGSHRRKVTQDFASTFFHAFTDVLGSGRQNQLTDRKKNAKTIIRICPFRQILSCSELAN